MLDVTFFSVIRWEMPYKGFLYDAFIWSRGDLAISSETASGNSSATYERKETHCRKKLRVGLITSVCELDVLRFTCRVTLAFLVPVDWFCSGSTPCNADLLAILSVKQFKGLSSEFGLVSTSETPPVSFSTLTSNRNKHVCQLHYSFLKSQNKCRY